MIRDPQRNLTIRLPFRVILSRLVVLLELPRRRGVTMPEFAVKTFSLIAVQSACACYGDKVGFGGWWPILGWLYDVFNALLVGDAAMLPPCFQFIFLASLGGLQIDCLKGWRKGQILDLAFATRERFKLQVDEDVEQSQKNIALDKRSANVRGSSYIYDLASNDPNDQMTGAHIRAVQVIGAGAYDDSFRVTPDRMSVPKAAHNVVQPTTKDGGSGDAAIDYFYKLEYLHEPAPKGTVNCHLLEHAKVFAMAVKYQITGLRALASDKFKHSITIDPHSHFLDLSFPEVIRVVHASTPDDILELRKPLADTIYQYLDVLSLRPAVDSVLRNIPSVAYDVLQRSKDGSWTGIDALGKSNQEIAGNAAGDLSTVCIDQTRRLLRRKCNRA
ncbi:hypothetical protein Q7P37_005516 [Cladosporium fusiforme]